MATKQNHSTRPAVLQRLVYNFLIGGKKYSAADIATALHLSDPRGHISQLRKKGINIQDEWRQGVYGRYKVYYLREFE
ncbi:MAG: hypothetical protein IJ553_05280 [Alloprevotella sp.]|nr:hypothetical protein [Alloprevotella sp.]